MIGCSGRVVAFRADASLQIGTGHVMRCLSLADELRNRGATCYFICRRQAGELISEIHRRGYIVHALATETQVDSTDATLDYQTWDSNKTKTILSATPADLLVVDHYELAEHWETAVRAGVRHLMVIDDVANRFHSCDLLLDQNLGRADSQYGSLVPTHCRLMMGPKFALLRPEFAQWRDYSLRRRESGSLRQLLISMGGVDSSNITGQVISALNHCELPRDCNVTVLLGRHSPVIDDVNRRARQLPWAMQILVDTPDVAQIMANSDLAVGAAGGTAWERCCLGLPTAIVVIAENQRAGARALSLAGAAEYLDDPSALPKAIERLAQPGRLAEMSSKTSSIVDGSGTQRVCQEIGAVLAAA